MSIASYWLCGLIRSWRQSRFCNASRPVPITVSWVKAAAGGYIWHTTGSGKDVDQFQGGAMARGLPDIDKVLFVVDRKDLDYQTMREYDDLKKARPTPMRRLPYCRATGTRTRASLSPPSRSSAASWRRTKTPIPKAHVVVIFDECHRSQFGDMHAGIPGSSSAITCRLHRHADLRRQREPAG